MTPQDFYRTHTPFTDPQEHAYLFDNLPQDVAELCRLVHGLHFHFREELDGDLLPLERQREVNLRTVSAMLTRASDLESQSTLAERSPEKRVVGCCRDVALLLCAMLRHQGVPARIRVGFSPYYYDLAGFNSDHVVTEYWDGQQWQLADAQLKPPVKINGAEIDLQNLPAHGFFPGGRVWQMCLEGDEDPDDFGHAPDAQFSGWWAIRDALLRDLAAQNKVELLLWDSWPWVERDFRPTDQERCLLDRIAELTLGGENAFGEMRALYTTDERVQVPDTVLCDCPVGALHPYTWRRRKNVLPSQSVSTICGNEAASPVAAADQAGRQPVSA